VLDPILHPRDRSGRFVDSGTRGDPLLARLERRLAAVQRRLRRAEALRAGRAGWTLCYGKASKLLRRVPGPPENPVATML
jgi:hypothetical protein